MLHPAIELRFVNPEVGYGVFAVEDIPMGTITWALDPLDQIIGPARAEDVDALLPRELRRYSWLNGQGDRILCWDFGRYMNHSCEPNSVGPGILEMEVAVRDIVAGEEVTCDYGTFNLEESMPCSCGTPSCRGIVARADAARIVPRLDRRVRRAFGHLKQVDQPLWGLVQRWRLEIERGLARPAHLPSLLENRWPRAGEGESLPRARAGA